MSLATLLPPQQVFRLRAASKDAVLAELSRRAAAAIGIAVAGISAAVAARERLGSTGVGSGIAIPHARLERLDTPAAFFARLDRLVDWMSIDGRPVDLVCLLLSPLNADADHLSALAAITRRLRQPSIAALLRSAREDRELLLAIMECDAAT